jgi:GNAT superfamily N-acetyltransferase
MSDQVIENIRIEVIEKGHRALAPFFHTLPKDSGWPEGTVLSLTDREPTEFESAEIYVAAFQDDKIVGALSFHPAASGNYHRQHNVHFHIDILPAWQGIGVGKAILARTIRHAGDCGYSRIYVGSLSWNKRALALFGSFGFRVEGVSRGAYKVRSTDGEEYFLDGIGLALWIGPNLHFDHQAGSMTVVADSRLQNCVYRSDARVESDEMVALYRSVGDHRHKYREVIKGAWSHSSLNVIARIDGVLVGMARGLTDRNTTFFVCDLMVHPDHQGEGIGTELLDRLTAPYRDIYQTILLTDPETIPFYKKLGFIHWESACLKMHPLTK